MMLVCCNRAQTDETPNTMALQMTFTIEIDKNIERSWVIPDEIWTIQILGQTLCLK